MTTLGKLERVDLRDAWETEDQHFTPWLAQEDNLTILGDTIGIELELEAQEKNVGPFRADILCKDTATDSWVLIENQLQRTDHTHLGQLLTYAAGLQAVTIVWISRKFTDEHRAALDWLNEITDDSFHFFGLEVELWRIDNSPPAPKFNVVSKPNEWSRSISEAARGLAGGKVSERKASQLEYWRKFRSYLEKNHVPLRATKEPRPKPSYSMSIGRAGFRLVATLSSSKKRIGVEVQIGADDAEAFFNLLKDDQDKIEQETLCHLVWEELPGRKRRRMATYKDNTDPDNSADWPNQHAWMADMLNLFDKTFRSRIKNLDASEWSPEEKDEDDNEDEETA